MNIYYAHCAGRPDATGNNRVRVSLETALEVFRGLDVDQGYMGVVLNERYTLQLHQAKNGRARIQLLDTILDTLDECQTEGEFAESLIQAAADGREVFQIARAGATNWNFWELQIHADILDDPVAIALRCQRAVLEAFCGPPKPPQLATFPMVSITSGEGLQLWVSISFRSVDKKPDVLQLAVVPAANPVFLQRSNPKLACIQGAERIEVASDSITVTLNAMGQMILDLPTVMRFTTNNENAALKSASGIFAKMKQFESDNIIKLQ